MTKAPASASATLALAAITFLIFSVSSFAQGAGAAASGPSAGSGSAVGSPSAGSAQARQA